MKIINIEEASRIYSAKEELKIEFYKFELTFDNGNICYVDYNVRERGGTLEEIMEEISRINWGDLAEFCLHDGWLNGGDLKDHEQEESICNSILHKFKNRLKLTDYEYRLINNLFHECTIFTEFDYNTWVL